MIEVVSVGSGRALPSPTYSDYDSRNHSSFDKELYPQVFLLLKYLPNMGSCRDENGSLFIGFHLQIPPTSSPSEIRSNHGLKKSTKAFD